MPAIIKVSGDSMSPTLENGDYILTFKPRTFRAGFIYVLNHDRMGRIVKRLSHQTEDEFWFEGDNAASSSLDKIGCVTRDQIIGHAVLRITPKGVRKL